MSRTHALTREALQLRRPILLPLRISAWMSLRRQRAQLGRLESDRLADIGLTHRDALQETRRPFWDVPASWVR